MGQAVSQGPRDVGLPFPLQEGERIIQLCRRHWIYLWPTILAQALIGLVPVAALGILLLEIDAYEGLAAQAYWAVSVLWALYWAARMFLSWYRYQNDIWAITNQRIVDSYKRHPFSLRISTADLVNVQDMSIEREGILRTLLDFGDIVCQTAAEGQDFRLSGIPDPRAVQALVDRERDRERFRSA
ncbi:MAG TPA: hypothetical protein VNN21_11190 [Dehalococcoidia bacterium]|nr:hypothetical protein [Dehalococcoidia bacterium]